MAAAPSTRAMAIVLLLLLFSINHPRRSHAFSLMNYLCNNGTSYGINSTYHSNVVALLGSLSANASSSAVGFATGTVGRTPDQTWGLALCRGDVNGTACASCLALAPGVAFGDCRGVRDVSIYYDRCLLRFSDKDFLATPDDPAAPVQYSPNLLVNVTIDPGRFVRLAADLIGALSAWAARNSTSRYAAGVMTSAEGFTTTDFDLVHKIYGLVQCTPDQSPEACQGCLGRLRDEMPAVFNGTTGGQFNAVWCNLRYDVFLFYDSSPVVNLVAPPPSTPPAPSGAAVHNDANRTRGAGNAATVVAIVLGVLVAILVSTFVIYLWRKARVKQYAEEDDNTGSLLFDLTTLRRATANFAEENKLGHGGFGAVYKGFLPDGRQIAVKRLDKASGQGLKELRNELLLVAKLRHNNLAKLLGVYVKGQEKLIVYEYLPNRSLDTFLFVPERRQLLDWETRYRIIYGTARGLLYLHEDSQTRIIHRDLKASNILLDADMNPKISDFGLARLFGRDKTTTVTSQVVGTLGYMAPEYAFLGHLSVKLDVYSFGVLMLEIITGRKNTDMFESASVDESTILLCYVWDHWLRGTALETMDPSLDGHAPESEVLKCVHLGLLCVQENAADRPTMLDVLVMLHGQSSSFAMPSKPAYFASAFCEMTSSDKRGNMSGGLEVAVQFKLHCCNQRLSDHHRHHGLRPSASSLRCPPPFPEPRFQPHELAVHQRQLLRPQLHLSPQRRGAPRGPVRGRVQLHRRLRDWHGGPRPGQGVGTRALPRRRQRHRLRLLPRVNVNVSVNVNGTAGVAFGDCRGIRDVSIYYDRCLLRYSEDDFLASPDDPTAPVQYGLNLEVNITGDPGRFVRLAADLVSALSGWAARNSTARYAAGVVTSAEEFTTTDFDLVHDIYGLVQCMPDHAPEPCLGCLGRLRDEMPTVFNGTTGAQFNLVWCNLRYEVFPFYDGSPVVKLVAPPPTLAPAGASGRNDVNRPRGAGNVATVVAIVLGVVLAVVLVSTFIIFFLRRKAQVKQCGLYRFTDAEVGEDHAGSLLFDMATLRRATENFAEENKLGHGGFGAVYKGFLPDGREIAVKRLDKASAQGLKQLKNELLLVAKLRHNNLAKLYGVCLKEQEKLLVYEYLPNRSLDTSLFVPEKRLLLGWETRYRIIYGTARGRLYLHEDSQIKVMHRDLKASNILLDADMNPKISDFGLARLFNGDKTSTVTSQVVGTLGYMALEYAVMGRLSVKLDVYSFGVLVLEILTGRSNTDACFESEADHQESSTMLSYVWDHWSKGTALEAMDPSLADCETPGSEVLKCIHLGLLCVQENPADRPTMLDVLVMLHGQTSSFAAPSKPAFAFARGEMLSSNEGDNVPAEKVQATKEEEAEEQLFIL
ncbi:Cysteine-rich receptor-like protein kinase 25 [Dichanthelium oligosanthes]|uniref:Cysteine-rich receptor-like protein kinase 25 n=1 Tax=Dichanthelium oligosanthes TaxID=888268 RepID=A0A1E5WAG8_9POAL|nr:Cysteine-rich receptor-like protein kinase 25 [Dichanthelium oligosanthes]